jgi:signal transduction histidine kinase
MKSKDPSSTLIAFGFGGVVLGLVVSMFFHHSLYTQLDALDLEASGSLATLKVLVIATPLAALILVVLFAIFMNTLVKKYTNEINQTKRLLENVLNSLPQRIFWKDNQGCYQGANHVFLGDYGFSCVQEIIGKTDVEIGLLAAQAEAYAQEDATIVAKNAPLVKLRSEQDIPSLGRIVFEGTKVPLRDRKGQVIGVIGVFEDITKALAQEAQLIRQSRLAQMGEMISMIAHQWRQPLNVISTTSGAIKLKFFTNNVIESEIMGHLERIEDQTEHLSSTIEDFRNFFKPDMGKSEVTPQELIHDTLSIIKPSLDSDRIALDTLFTCNPSLNTHRNKLMHVLLNLIKNAHDVLKEKKVAEPVIGIKVASEADKTVISITDNGGGIPGEIMDKIFLPYFSTKASKNGTGLGLHMSKTIIEEHCNGKLEAVNTDTGACFRILL